MKKNTWLVMGTVGVLLLGGCGGASDKCAVTESYVGTNGYYDRDMADEMYYYESEVVADTKATEPTAGGSFLDGGIGLNETDMSETELYHTENEKLIRTVSMQLQTKEFEALLGYLDSRVAELGGYIQNSQIYGNSMDTYGYRSANIVFRIPQNSLDAFVSGVSENATVVRKSENAENITLKYADTEAKLKSLKIEQERFLELLEKAETVESILVLEEHLTELRYEIESYASMLKVYDNKVNYSTVTLDISEVKRTTSVEQNPTLFSRMKEGFLDTCYRIKEGAADFLVWFVTNLFYLLIWGAILGVVFFVVRKKRKAKRRKAVAAKENVLQPSDEENNDRMDTEK